jgi:hypothetical protein
MKKTGRPITIKSVRVHFECICGVNVVDDEQVWIKWNDLAELGIVRKRDKRTGHRFLFKKMFSKTCHCNDEIIEGTIQFKTLPYAIY